MVPWTQVHGRLPSTEYSVTSHLYTNGKRGNCDGVLGPEGKSREQSEKGPAGGAAREDGRVYMQGTLLRMLKTGRRRERDKDEDETKTRRRRERDKDKDEDEIKTKTRTR